MGDGGLWILLFSTSRKLRIGEGFLIPPPRGMAYILLYSVISCLSYVQAGRREVLPSECLQLSVNKSWRHQNRDIWPQYSGHIFEKVIGTEVLLN